MSKIIRSITGSKEHLHRILVDYVYDIESNGITQMSIEWYKARKQYVTGTSFSKITSQNPINGILQLLSNVKISQNIAMMWGIMFEDAAAQIIEYSHSSRVYGANCFICDYSQHIAYSPDGFIIIEHENNNEIMLLEIKCPYSRRSNLHKVPSNYLPQVELGLYITGLQNCLFVQAVFTRISLSMLCLNTDNLSLIDKLSSIITTYQQEENDYKSDEDVDFGGFTESTYFGYHIIYSNDQFMPEIIDYGSVGNAQFDYMMENVIDGTMYSQFVEFCDIRNQESVNAFRIRLSKLWKVSGIIGILPWQVSSLNETIHKTTGFALSQMHKVMKYSNITKKIASGESPMNAIYSEFRSDAIPIPTTIPTQPYLKKLKYGKLG